jgi:hypothetical protein
MKFKELKKNLLFFLFVLLLFTQNNVNAQTQQSSLNNAIYYFCISRTLDQALVNEVLEEIKYTEIKTTKLPNSNKEEMTRKWAKYSHDNCLYEQCISDVHFYDTLEKARERFSELINVNLETSRYVLVAIDI